MGQAWMIACVMMLGACGDDAPATVDNGDVGGAVDSLATDSVDPDDAAEASDATTTPTDDADSVMPHVDLPPLSASPCDHMMRWPLQLPSTTYPFVVHYNPVTDVSVVETVRDSLDAAWALSTEQLGFRPPLDDMGTCGPDGRFDVFLWPGQESAWVEWVAEFPATDGDDALTMMVIDPDSDYGGDLLDVTLAHELNHACQASDDWFESAAVYEMTATYVEALAAPADLRWAELTLPDFQAEPWRTLGHDDGYETWSMYGASLYFHVLQAVHFPDDPAFAGRLWSRLRGASEASWLVALDALLAEEAGTDVAATVVELSKWRWYIGDRDDGRHLSFGGALSAQTQVPLAATVAGSASGAASIDPGVAILGSHYVALTGAPGASVVVSASAPGAPGTVAVAAIEAPDEPLASTTVRSTLTTTIPATGTRVVAVTLLPQSLTDPVDATQRFALALEWSTP